MSTAMQAEAAVEKARRKAAEMLANFMLAMLRYEVVKVVDRQRV